MMLSTFRARRVLALHLTTFIVTLAYSLSFPASAAHASSKKWYEGGTLHQANLSSWARASDANRLATSADFAAAAKEMTSMEEMAIGAAAIAMCIDKVAAEPVAGNQRAIEIAALCAMQMKFFAE